MYRRRMSPLEESIEPEPTSGCWLWTGALDGKGYGHLNRGGKSLRAHRVMYEQRRGPIPDGQTIDHLCRIRSCVNPDHLEIVSMRENILRGESQSAKDARRTYCLHGHLLDGRRSNRKRYCRTCAREYQREVRALAS